MPSEIEKVITGGYCIGCGACAATQSPPRVQIELTNHGFFQAKIDTAAAYSLKNDKVCPFSNKAANEDQLSEKLHQTSCSEPSNALGRYSAIYAGHVAESDFRSRGSSGGFTSWIIASLLQKGHVDAVVHVKPRVPTENDRRIYEYGISRSLSELQEGSKSHYYPVEMSGVLQTIRDKPARYLVVGVPCFIKSLRLLAFEDKLFEDRIRFCIGLFCGHLKGTGFAELLGWQTGVRPEQLAGMDFRTKIDGRPSSKYGITAHGIVDGQLVERTAMVSEMLGTDWGMGFFKYKACDFCDDISAELADVSVGDAWLPQFTDDSRGTNVVIVRHPVIQALVDESIKSGSLQLKPLSEEDAIQSQGANFRHRREDLSYRLHFQDLKGKWRPIKRVEPAPLPKRSIRRVIQNQRMYFQEKIPVFWAIAKERGDLSFFVKKVDPLIRKYSALYLHSTAHWKWPNISPVKGLQGLKHLLRRAFRQSRK